MSGWWSASHHSDVYTCHSKADWRGGGGCLGGGFRGFHLRSGTFELVVMEDIMVGRHGWEPGCQERYEAVAPQFLYKGMPAMTSLPHTPGSWKFY